MFLGTPRGRNFPHSLRGCPPSPQLMEIQADYHRKSLSSLDTALAELRENHSQAGTDRGRARAHTPDPGPTPGLLRSWQISSDEICDREIVCYVEDGVKGQDWSQENFRRQKGGNSGLAWGGSGGVEGVRERCWMISGSVVWVIGREVVPLAKAVGFADV